MADNITRGSLICIFISLVASSGLLQVIWITSRIQRQANVWASSLPVGIALCVAWQNSLMGSIHCGALGATVSGAHAKSVSSSSSLKCFWYMFISPRVLSQSIAVVLPPATIKSTKCCKRRLSRCAFNACDSSSAIWRLKVASGAPSHCGSRLALRTDCL